jgi:hypothetical protein
MNDSTQDNSTKLVLSWALVGVPLLWGFYLTLQNAMALFW